MANPSSDDFQQAASMLSGIRRQQADLDAAVTSGGFRVTPEAATNAAKACRDHKDRLNEALEDAQNLQRTSGFGECRIGEQLADKFAKKADGGPTSLIPLLRKAQDILENMARTFEAAGRAYHQADDDNRRAFSRGDE
ncbi:hypothetical protein LX15_005782 [Streptoalloteichus tenebrarius]|uniref:Uncharacterized protein n=1 Tax=Streptoalloteichus tenebrarius (strain ATCC 17920 / DSM 40477 / JCM 4838 / CBS 697.72 / NBRC 16177 / NCIMB 11028 / NRRL B-12390 / A12253. 1 / ISP 5477) TaxID=1933 RepID=A0ABT1I2M9_STRSD|nr:hypothetical protein [Streptoalloteichus tenebrarius]MCP2262050.1 hypothetical protein [Streptoalloteichus tenebrarius]BFF01310.1 hypothetical protein GCM10020241_29850 [Streptoalloteichus tenebrarius]